MPKVVVFVRAHWKGRIPITSTRPLATVAEGDTSRVEKQTGVYGGDYGNY
jgi:hypothetical protein